MSEVIHKWVDEPKRIATYHTFAKTYLILNAETGGRDGKNSTFAKTYLIPNIQRPAISSGVQASYTSEYKSLEPRQRTLYKQMINK